MNETATPRRILQAMHRAGVSELPVARADGTFLGMVEQHAVDRRLYDRGEEGATAEMMADEAVARATADEPIEAAVDKMLAAELDVMPIVSPTGRLDGMLVLDDLRHVPQLVEAVGVSRQQRAAVAEGGVHRVMIVCGLVSALLGVALFALWIEGPGYRLPGWVAWVDGLASALAFIGAGLAASREMFSIPLWAASGVGLWFTALCAHAWGHGTSSTWLQFVLGAVFLGMMAVLGLALPRRHHAVHPRRLALT